MDIFLFIVLILALIALVAVVYFGARSGKEAEIAKTKAEKQAVANAKRAATLAKKRKTRTKITTTIE